VREIVATAHADLRSSVIQEGTFRKVEDGLFVQVSERLPDGRLGGIIVADSREKNVDLVFYAKQGEIYRQDDSHLLFMRDGEVHRKSPGGDVSVIRFASYAFDLSEFSPKTGDVFLLPKDRTLGYLLAPDPDDRIFKEIPRHYTAELHRRFTEWTYPIIFALFALAAAGDVRSHRQARIHPMVTAIACAMVARWEGYFLADKIEDSRSFIPVLYGMIAFNGLFALFFIATGRVMEMPASWSETIADGIAGIRNRLAAVARRFLPAGPAEGRT
jgi:lipopolysaccharide export system permease protein